MRTGSWRLAWRRSESNIPASWSSSSPTTAGSTCRAAKPTLRCARARVPEGGGIVAQRLPDALWSLYCSHGYAAEHGAPAGPSELDGHAVVGLDGPLANLPAFLWLRRIAPNASISARSNSLTNLVSALKAGLGVGPLPCVFGDGEADLLRCFPPIPELDAELWLIIREDIKQAPHVRAFVDFLAAHLRARLVEA